MTKTKVAKKDEQLSETKTANVEKKTKTPKSKEPETTPKVKETKTKETKAKSKDSKQKSKSSKTQDVSKDDKDAKRSFKGIYVNCEGVVVLSGRYCGKKPMQAARKALTGIYRLYNSYNKQHPKSKKVLSGVVYFGVKETSRQSKHKKTYWYAGEKQELEVPHERELNTIDEKTGKNKVIIHKSKNEVKKASLDDCKHLMQYVEDDDEDVKPKAKKTSTKKAKDSKKVTPKKTKKTETPAPTTDDETPKVTPKKAKKAEATVTASATDDESPKVKKAPKKDANKSKK